MALVPVNTDTRQTGLITFLLDRSYSMNQVLHATIEGFNGYLDGLQREKDADISFTLLTFDSQSIDTIHAGVPIHQAQLLTEQTYRPRGGTPLIEASIKTILSVEETLRQRTDNPRVVICIQTDGEENQSGRDYTRKALKDLIARKEKEGWEFNFLGAGIDAYAQAKDYGFKEANTMSYDLHNISATRSAFAATASTASNFAAGRVGNTAYSAQDRTDAGDRFYRPVNPTTKP